MEYFALHTANPAFIGFTQSKQAHHQLSHFNHKRADTTSLRCQTGILPKSKAPKNTHKKDAELDEVIEEMEKQKLVDADALAIQAEESFARAAPFQ